MNINIVIRTILLASTIAFMPGCEAKRERTPPPKETSIVQVDQSQYIVMLVLDLSGSFEQQMTDGGQAWTFAGMALDRYFRDRRENRHDRFIIAQVSGTTKSLLWEGTPEHFRRDFTGESFREFLKEKADPNGSKVYDGVSHALGYFNRIPNVRNGAAKSAVLILSDLMDNGPDKEAAEKRFLTSITDFDKLGGVGGIWYCDQDEYMKWRPALDNAGLDDFIIECDFKGHPTLPSFQQ